ncbi:MAG TPA: helix-turn-helix transcriptional regulator [Blastocatellia bacterium]
MNPTEADTALMTLDELREKLRPCNFAIIAERLGVTRQAVSLIVAGKRKPGPRILKKLGLQQVIAYRQIRRSGNKQ